MATYMEWLHVYVYKVIENALSSIWLWDRISQVLFYFSYKASVSNIWGVRWWPYIHLSPSSLDSLRIIIDLIYID